MKLHKKNKKDLHPNDADIGYNIDMDNEINDVSEEEPPKKQKKIKNKKIKNKKKNTIQEDFTDEDYDLLYEINSEKHKNRNKNIKKAKKSNFLNALVEINKYDATFKASNYWEIFAISLAGLIVLGFLFKLSLPFLLIIVLMGMICIPKIIIAYSRNKYEEHKLLETTAYIEQMLYSFRRNSKIITSLLDATVVFQEGLMHDCIMEAIDYIRNQTTNGNVYEEALSVIEENYSCRRIKSLHRFLIKVEGAGGDHDMGVTALLADRRLWIERNDDFKKEKSSVVKEIIISSLFSTGVILITMHMLPQNIHAAEHIICRIASTIYIIVNLFTVTAAFTKTINYLDDIDDLKYEQRLKAKLEWYKTFDIRVERKKAIKPMIAFLLCAITGVIVHKLAIVIMCILMAVFAVLLQPLLKYRTAKKTIMNQIEKVYPDWLLELSLLLQTDNLHVALEKTLEEAPLIIKEDLEKLADEIAMYPTEIEPYNNFLNYLPLANIHSSMRLLYSISEFGSEEEEKQISELIERNATLMNKAEEQINNNKLASIYLFKFVPMLSSSLMLIISMVVFLIVLIKTAVPGT